MTPRMQCHSSQPAQVTPVLLHTNNTISTTTDCILLLHTCIHLLSCFSLHKHCQHSGQLSALLIHTTDYILLQHTHTWAEQCRVEGCDWQCSIYKPHKLSLIQ